MRRLIKRNLKYIITVLVILVLVGIALGHTRIRTVDDVRQEAQELAGMTTTPAGIDGTESSDSILSEQQEEGIIGNVDDTEAASADTKQTDQAEEGSSTDQTEKPSVDSDTGNQGSKPSKTISPTVSKKKSSKQKSSKSTTRPAATATRKISNGTSAGQDAYHTDPIPSGKPEPVNTEDQSVDKTSQFYVYLSIDVMTILDHMDDLTKGLEKYVPEDGWILPKTKVLCYEGETVWDVLSRECKARDISIQSQNTQIYGSVYLEGINNISQFDCGALSGWMYAVDDWFPNYGCSRYVLVEGEYIQWRYSCTGMGSDLK